MTVLGGPAVSLDKAADPPTSSHTASNASNDAAPASIHRRYLPHIHRSGQDPANGREHVPRRIPTAPPATLHDSLPGNGKPKH